jgi:hypothetical protein
VQCPEFKPQQRRREESEESRMEGRRERRKEKKKSKREKFWLWYLAMVFRGSKISLSQTFGNHSIFF